MTATTDSVTDYEQDAEAAGLRYVTDTKPGIRREGSAGEFRYLKPDGNQVTPGRTLARIEKLVIPPAWKDVWITTDPRGHLQATGRDVRNRKQYRYHAKWREHRDDSKFYRMIDFAEALPTIRQQADRDLRKTGMPREKAIATVVRLLETTLIRVGNEVYAQENKSYGLTTMRNRHVEIEGTTIHFRFDGKSGVHHEIDLADRRLAGIVRKMRDLPGYHLFQYLDENNQPQEISSDDVNRYLQSVAGSEFTAKDFRTWAGTVLCAVALRDTDAWATPAEADKRVVAAVKEVAKSLGNTPAVCRKCYIHPNIINAYLDPKTQATIWQKTQQIIEQGSESGTLSEEEEAVLRLLKSTTVKN